MSVLHQVGAAIPSAANIGGYGSPLSWGLRVERVARYLFCIALRSTKVLPPFILWASGASLIWITTASASTPRFVTSACVMARIMPAFCSSVRPAAMLMVISGIVVTPFSLATSRFTNTILKLEEPRHLAPTSSSAKADDPVFRAGYVQRRHHGVLDARFRGHDGSS